MGGKKCVFINAGHFKNVLAVGGSVVPFALWGYEITGTLFSQTDFKDYRFHDGYKQETG